MTLIALQLVARWCFSSSYSGWEGGVGGLEKELESEWFGAVGLILSVTLSRFVRDDIRPPLFTPAFASHPSSIAFCQIRTDDLGFSLSMHLSWLFPLCLFYFFPPLLSSISVPLCLFLCLALSLSRMGLICDRTNRLIVFCESRQGSRDEAYFIETWIGYPPTGERGPAGTLNASRKHGWSGGGKSQ